MKEPEGYQEIGSSLAQVVAEGAKTIGWLLEIGGLLGYKQKTIRAWLDCYREQHAAELEALERRRNRVSRKVNRKRSQADDQNVEAAKRLWGLTGEDLAGTLPPSRLDRR